MTDHQFDSIIDMVGMILDGCEDLREAKEKIGTLKRDNRRSEDKEDKED